MVVFFCDSKQNVVFRLEYNNITICLYESDDINYSKKKNCCKYKKFINFYINFIFEEVEKEHRWGQPKSGVVIKSTFPVQAQNGQPGSGHSAAETGDAG